MMVKLTLQMIELIILIGPFPQYLWSKDQGLSWDLLVVNGSIRDVPLKNGHED